MYCILQLIDKPDSDSESLFALPLAPRSIHTEKKSPIMKNLVFKYEKSNYGGTSSFQEDKISQGLSLFFVAVSLSRTLEHTGP